MATTYTSIDGDTVDYIAFNYYGFTSGGIVEQIYAANPGLADKGPILKNGVTVKLPDLAGAVSTTTKGVRLWD